VTQAGHSVSCWKPDIPGKYTVIATFAGSASYYGSYVETTFGVEEAPDQTVDGLQ